MKNIVLFSLLFFVLSDIYASYNSINTSVSPYSFQNASTKNGVKDNSSYGWATKPGYRYHISDSFSIGADATYSRFSHENLYGNEKYNVLSLQRQTIHFFLRNYILHV